MRPSFCFAAALLTFVLSGALGCGSTAGGTTGGPAGSGSGSTAAGSSAGTTGTVSAGTTGGSEATSGTTGGSAGKTSGGSASGTGGTATGTTGGTTSGTSAGTSGTTTGAAPASLSIAINPAEIEGTGCFPPAEFSVCQAGYGFHTICSFTITNVGSSPTGALAYAFAQGADGGFGVEFDGCTGVTLGAAAQCLMQVTSWTESTPVGHTGSLTLVDTTNPVDDAGIDLTITSASDAGC